MSDRKLYVYRLDVVYPEGSDAGGWEPERWEPTYEIDYQDGPQPIPFRWPSRRHYGSRSGAKKRADLLTEWGAKVTIVRSNPVTWSWLTPPRCTKPGC